MALKRPYVLAGTGGWLWAQLPEVPECDLYIRVTELPSGRLGISAIEIAVRDPERTVDASVLRRIPTGRIEALINEPTHAQQLRSRIAADGAETDRRDTRARSERAPSDPDQALRAVPRFVLRLRVPAGRTKPDAFYEKVAEIYSLASAYERSPARLIADANNVPVTTVHGWVKEARRRKLLAPGRRGGSDA